MDRIPNFVIFDRDSGYWIAFTDNGKLPMPEYVTAVVFVNNVILEERKYPITEIDENKWIINYSNTI